MGSSYRTNYRRSAGRFGETTSTVEISAPTSPLNGSSPLRSITRPSSSLTGRRTSVNQQYLEIPTLYEQKKIVTNSPPRRPGSHSPWDYDIDDMTPPLFRGKDPDAELDASSPLSSSSKILQVVVTRGQWHDDKCPIETTSSTDTESMSSSSPSSVTVTIFDDHSSSHHRTSPRSTITSIKSMTTTKGIVGNRPPVGDQPLYPTNNPSHLPSGFVTLPLSPHKDEYERIKNMATTSSPHKEIILPALGVPDMEGSEGAEKSTMTHQAVSREKLNWKQEHEQPGLQQEGDIYTTLSPVVGEDMSNNIARAVIITNPPPSYKVVHPSLSDRPRQEQHVILSRASSRASSTLYSHSGWSTDDDDNSTIEYYYSSENEKDDYNNDQPNEVKNDEYDFDDIFLWEVESVDTSPPVRLESIPLDRTEFNNSVVIEQSNVAVKIPAMMKNSRPPPRHPPSQDTSTRKNNVNACNSNTTLEALMGLKPSPTKRTTKTATPMSPNSKGGRQSQLFRRVRDHVTGVRNRVIGTTTSSNGGNGGDAGAGSGGSHHYHYRGRQQRLAEF